MATTDAEHGHHWKEADRVAHFAARMDERAAEREAQFNLLGRLLPYESGDAFHILDVGAGYGAVAESLLRHFPAARATLLDLSDAMIEEGRRRLSSLDGRFNYVQGDFADGSLPHDVAGPYEVIVSSLAIHHLPPDGKRDLYADIASRLTPGGCFFNIDSVGAADAETEAIYTRTSAARIDPFCISLAKALLRVVIGSFARVLNPTSLNPLSCNTDMMSVSHHIITIIT